MKNKIVLAVGAIVTAFMVMFGVSSAASASTIIRSGTGWSATGSIYRIDKNATYYITFDDSIAMYRLTPYVKIFAADLTKYTGVKVVVTRTIEKIDQNVAPKYHHWVLDYKYRPNGAQGVSVTVPWHANGYSWGGYSYIDSEYWTWKLAKYRIANIVSHEGGHMMGLEHPNSKDSNGNIVNYGCPKWGSPARYPLMCFPNGGYQSDANGGKFTHYDQIGLKQMVLNAG